MHLIELPSSWRTKLIIMNLLVPKFLFMRFWPLYLPSFSSRLIHPLNVQGWRFKQVNKFQETKEYIVFPLIFFNCKRQHVMVTLLKLMSYQKKNGKNLNPSSIACKISLLINYVHSFLYIVWIHCHWLSQFWNLMFNCWRFFWIGIGKVIMFYMFPLLIIMGWVC